METGADRALVEQGLRGDIRLLREMQRRLGTPYDLATERLSRAVLAVTRKRKGALYRHLDEA